MRCSILPQTGVADTHFHLSSADLTQVRLPGGAKAAFGPCGMLRDGRPAGPLIGIMFEGEKGERDAAGVTATERKGLRMLYDNVMVPYDGSPSSRAALEEAVRFAREDPGMTLRIVHILDTETAVAALLEKESRAVSDVPSAHIRELLQRVIDEADKAVHRQIDDILEGLSNRVVIEFLEETSPGSQIVSYAADNGCDLIIMGSRGLGAIRGMLGSVSNYVLREASVPVLVAKAAD